MIINVITIACVAMIGWLAWSFIDIVSDNNTMNPEHSNINAFSVLVKDTEEVKATVIEVNNEAIALEDASGDVWVWELEKGESFEVGQIVTIVFDNLGNDDIYDDEIIKVVE
jgi:hypothetical protein